MRYRVVNIKAETVKELMEYLGDRVIRCMAWHDDGCLDIDIDPEITILKINGGNLTVDRGGVLYTIMHNDYSSLEVI